MTANSNLLRSIVTYSIILPLALWIGYELAQPLDRVSLISFVLILAVISSPLLLKWQRPLLILSWNLGAVVFFLPGSPDLWLVLAFASLAISIVQKTLIHEFRFIHAPSLVAPLLFIAIVVLVTAKYTGGFGLHSLGSSTVGAGRYWKILGGVAGFLAMLGHRIPPRKAGLYVGLFFLAAFATLIGNVVYNFVPQLYYLCLLFPASQDFSEGSGFADVTRFVGLGMSFLAIGWYLLARYGITGMLSGRRLFLFVLLLASLLISLGSGYRGNVVLICLTLTTLFLLEGVWRTKYLGLFALGAILVCVLIVPFATKLPLGIQRSLSVLPIEVSPLARADAEGSSEWRIEMWKSVMPEIPKYFWFGRGLTLDAQEMILENDLSRTGRAAGYESFAVVSDFHNGPLSLIIPFGIWGVIGWLWFVGASFRALWLNRKYGEEHLQRFNNFILALFVAKTVFFFFVFGNFYTDLYQYCALVGFSMCLNYGIRRPVVVKPVYRPIPLRRRRPHLALAPATPRLRTSEH
jgi:hypothetical protein